MDFKIVRKTGWELNSDDTIVNDILKGLEKFDGHCPALSSKRRGHDQCPCSEYLEYNNCICGLYVKKEIKNEEM